AEEEIRGAAVAVLARLDDSEHAHASRAPDLRSALDLDRVELTHVFRRLFFLVERLVDAAVSVGAGGGASREQDEEREPASHGAASLPDSRRGNRAATTIGGSLAPQGGRRPSLRCGAFFPAAQPRYEPRDAQGALDGEQREQHEHYFRSDVDARRA